MARASLFPLADERIGRTGVTSPLSEYDGELCLRARSVAAGSSLRSVSTGNLGRSCRNLYSIGSRTVAVKESSLAVSLQHAD